jgi:hypothetical protein
MSLGKSPAAANPQGEMRLTLAELRDSLPDGGLLRGRSWRWSPEPLRLTREEARQMMEMGHPLAQFQQACDTLYRQSASGKLPAWLADLLDVGKPDWLVRIQREPATVGHLPRVIRPDLILTETGFAVTELDSVPGGMGVTAWLARRYSAAGFEVLGGPNGMLDGFRSLMPQGGTVLVSKESSDYQPEMAWLTGELGPAWTVAAAETYATDDQSLYRFFELYDWQSVPQARTLAEQTISGDVRITPPFKPHLEDKLWLALLWSPALKTFWEKTLRGNHLKRLRECVPLGWVLDPTPLPPHASLPHLDAYSWDEVARFSQKERRFALKISGFHETAWGSRGVFIGHDLSAIDWAERLHHALHQAQSHPWMLQEFREGRQITHPVFRDDGSVEMMRGRVRLCPYFFTAENGSTTFGGCLATIVPADKKKIHGMSDGICLPCVVE